MGVVRGWIRCGFVDKLFVFRSLGLVVSENEQVFVNVLSVFNDFSVNNERQSRCAFKKKQGNISCT